MTFNSSEKRAGKIQLQCETATCTAETVRMWDCHSCNVRLPHNIAVSFPPRLHPTRSLRDRSTHTRFTWTRFDSLWWNFFSNTLVGGGWEWTRQKNRTKSKGHLRTDSVYMYMRRFRRCSERRVRKPTKKKSRNFIAEARASLLQHMLFHRYVDEVTWKAHSQVTVTRTMEHRRQSNKKGSPTFPQLRLWTNGSVSQLNGDRATESGLTTQVLLLKSLESNGDRRNYLSSWEENVERRLTVVSEGPAWAETRRSRILDIHAIWSLDRAAAMSSPGFFFSERPRFVELPHRPGIIGSGCQPRLASLHAKVTPDCRRSRSAAPGKHGR